jgi:hypothetical protein
MPTVWRDPLLRVEWENGARLIKTIDISLKLVYAWWEIRKYLLRGFDFELGDVCCSFFGKNLDYNLEKELI